MNAELIGTIITACGAILVAFVQWRGKVAAQAQQTEADEQRQRADLQLAEINARRQADASNDAIIKRSLDMLDIVLTRVETSFMSGIDRIVAVQKEAQSEMLKMIRSQNDQALILMSDTKKHREDWQTLAMDTLEALPERTRQKLHQSFKQVPPETGDLILPRLDQLQAVIVTAIDDLEKRMIERINPDADNALVIVQRDMGALKQDCTQIFSKISSIQEWLDRMKLPESAAGHAKSGAPDGPGESKAPEETTVTISEELTNDGN